MNECEGCAKAKVCKERENFKLIAIAIANEIPIGSIFTVAIKCSEWLSTDKPTYR